MNRRRGVMLAGLGLLLAAGCYRYPPPSPDAVYYYLANARVHGKLRACWPAGQAYVNRVLKTDARLRDAAASLVALLDIDAVWPADDPRWRDGPALAEHAAELHRDLDVGAAQRARSLQELEQALNDLPAELGLEDSDAQSAFVERLWAALRVDGEDLRAQIAGLEAAAAARLRLVQEVRRCAAHFTKDESGLRFADSACQQAVDARYAEWADVVRARRSVFWAYAEERVPQIAAALQDIDKPARRGEYEYLNNEWDDLKLRLEASPKAYDGLIAEAEQKHKAHERGKQKLTSAEADFLARRIEQLKADRKASQERVERLLPPRKKR